MELELDAPTNDVIAMHLTMAALDEMSPEEEEDDLDFEDDDEDEDDEDEDDEEEEGDERD
jgi:hypothetical protein